MTSERVISYDVFRGVLLVAMVVFHIIVNLTSLKFNQELFYWVPLGFIFFLGVVLARFLIGKNTKKLKLGVKLLILFLVLNINNFISKEVSWLDFILGNQQIFSFEILFPMSLLIFSTLIFDKFKEFRWLLLLLLILILVFLNIISFYSYNLSFFIYGLIGYFLSFVVDLNGLLRKMSVRNLLLIIIFSVFPFFIVNYFGLIDLLIISQVLSLYFLCNRFLMSNKVFLFLGKNSLWLYVFHIFLIKAISVI